MEVEVRHGDGRRSVDGRIEQKSVATGATAPLVGGVQPLRRHLSLLPAHRLTVGHVKDTPWTCLINTGRDRLGLGHDPKTRVEKESDARCTLITTLTSSHFFVVVQELFSYRFSFDRVRRSVN